MPAASAALLHTATDAITVGSESVRIVSAVAAIALLALVFAVVFRRQVLAAGEGTQKMQDIARAVQEGLPRT